MKKDCAEWPASENLFTTETQSHREIFVLICFLCGSVSLW
jgi:hypothetical protein